MHASTRVFYGLPQSDAPFSIARVNVQQRVPGNQAWRYNFTFNYKVLPLKRW